jgi:alpha-glucosidase
VVNSQTNESDTTYQSPFGKNNPVRNHFNQLTLDMENVRSPLRHFQVIFRVYDDGIAYRYTFPKQAGIDSIRITGEPSEFRYLEDPRIWPLYRVNYTTSHEGIYDDTRFGKMATNKLIDLPLLAEFSDGTSVSFAQADLRNFAGLYLRAAGSGKARNLRFDLTPRPSEPGIKVKSALPLSSPWRVFLAGSAPPRLIESDVIANLNEPSVIGDASWLRAGKTTFYWWNGQQEPYDAAEAVQWEERYIDFCASNGILFHAVIGTEGDHPWYHQTKAGYSPPGPDADVTRPRDGFPIEQIVQYARSRGVEIRVWVHWKPLSQQLEKAFTQYEKWGLSGLMVDFLDRSDQDMVLFTKKVLQSAARHHLDIQFHGVWAPTGLSRTYPNLFNHEGVLNLEYLKWTNVCTPKHEVTVPFTRMAAGPMDFHLGGFRGSFRDGFKPRSVQPIVFGTRCRMLAMYVVYENPMPMLCDPPEAYAGQAGFDFLREVPTTWDETRVLDGQVGEYIVVARRQGETWYIGAMTDWTPRTLKLPLNFLSKGSYDVTRWTDVKNSDDPNLLEKSVCKMRNNSTLQIAMAGGGGATFCIRRQASAESAAPVGSTP